SAGLLPHSELVIGHTFDLGMKGVALGVQYLAADPPSNHYIADVRNLAALADESLNVEEREELAQPRMEQILGVIPRYSDVSCFAAFNRFGIGNQRVERFTRGSKKLW